MIQYNNFLMKREQSRAGSRFAECEKSRLKAKILITLALLLTAVTGAWADEKSETISTNTSQEEYTGEHFKITPNIKPDGLTVADLRYYADGQVYFSVQTLDGQNISKLDLQINYIDDTSIDNLSLSSGTKSYDSNTHVLTITNVNADHVQISLTEEDEFGIVKISSVTYYYEESSSGPEVTWTAATKTGTFTMPGYDVELTPIYAPAAQWATEGNEVLAPTAAEGVIAGTDAPLIVEGTVAAGQGTVMYFATTEQLTAEQAAQANGWLSTLPTAAGYDDATTVYVWYYIKGTDTPDGQEATADNTFNDSEICTTPLEVTVLSNKFDIVFKAANANTIDATQASKGTVTVSGTDKTGDITDGKLKAIKMGSEVKLKANNGYKFRKVEAKKKEKTYTITPRNMRVSYDYGNLTNEATLPYNTTTSELMKKVGLSSVNNSYNIQSVSLTSGSNVTLGTPTGTPGERGYEVPLTITGEGEFVLTVGRTNNNNDALIKVIVRANSDN